MKHRRRSRSGFALVLTLSLLALLVLAVLALSSLVRVDARVTAGSAARMRARENARLALDLAIGRLQYLAGPDDRVTGMGGVAGVPAGAGNASRQWCGVWEGGGRFLGWLASGADGSTLPLLASDSAATLVSTASVGSDSTDREHVKALRLPVEGVEDGGGIAVRARIAYWVGDEGVKLSCVLDSADTIEAGKRHAIDQHFVGTSLDSVASGQLLDYEQVNFANATTAQRQGGFHSHGLTHRSVEGSSLVAGKLNVNSTSARYWSGVAATFARFAPAAMGAATPSSMGLDAARVSGRPFLSVDDFFVAFAPRLSARGVDPAVFAATMRNWLCVRSDTFRVRGYGEALSAHDPLTVEAAAWCEAIVQRTPEAAPGGLGRRFVVISFRWLGQNDI